MSSNCSSTSFSSSLSNISFIKANRQKPEQKSDHLKNQFSVDNVNKNQKELPNNQNEDMKKIFKPKKVKHTRPIQVAQHNLMKNNQKLDYASHNNLFSKPGSLQLPEEPRNSHIDLKHNGNDENYTVNSK